MAKKKKPRFTKDQRRQIEIAEQFAEPKGMSAEEHLGSFVSAHSIFSPPWREFVNGELGPVYGPRKRHIYLALKERYLADVASGGLWDHARADAENPRRSQRWLKDRDDRDYILAILSPNDMPMKELEVFYLYFRDLTDLRRTAIYSNLSEGSVRSLIARIRTRADEKVKSRGGVRDQAGPVRVRKQRKNGTEGPGGVDPVLQPGTDKEGGRKAS